MEENHDSASKCSSFYDKHIHENENLHAKLKPILNQILENRVTVKELHTQFGIKFSEIINRYRNRNEDFGQNYDSLISELHERQRYILSKSEELLNKYQYTFRNNDEQKKE